MTTGRNITAYGARLKQARKHAKFTQVELAKRSGVKLSTLSELETVAHKSGFTAQLAKTCGVSALWLATGRGHMIGDIAEYLTTGVDSPRAEYLVTAATSPESTVRHLGELLLAQSPTRRRTISEVLARFALDPGDAELATEVLRQLQPDVSRGATSQNQRRTRAASK